MEKTFFPSILSSSYFFFSSVLVWNFSVFDFFFFFFKKTKYAKKHWEDKSKVNREGGGAVAEQAGDLHFS